ncbi:MAG: hypothetical protein RR361_05655 [Anaerovorax sp.]
MKTNVGIGFVTGRKNFKNLVKTYVNVWNESEFRGKNDIALHLFIAYDLKYSKTKVSDYKISDEEVLNMVDSVTYIGKSGREAEMHKLIEQGVLTKSETNLLFGEGYAKKRNTILYFAIKNKMDQLIFLDDDEYPMAAVKIDDVIFWRLQEIIATHIKNLKKADVTHGYHCGYISPIPYLQFDDRLREEEFRIFIEAISNDIISWDSVREKMRNGGVTFADYHIVNGKKTQVVKEINGMKFISGSNLGLNLQALDKVFPFYNPPRARGEDTFLSSCLGSCTVRKVPCYTFHDGFGMYKNLLIGVLPKKLKMIQADRDAVTKRFLRAAIGWTRYKPLFMYISDPVHFQEKAEKIYDDLKWVLPKLCNYFKNDEFQSILSEFEYYCKNVKKHNRDFQKTKRAWVKLMNVSGNIPTNLVD